MSIAEKTILPCQTSEKMQHIATMKKFLIFSERYLEKLVKTTVAVKKKNEKVVKIMNYNQQLQESLDDCLGKQSGRISLTNISLNSTRKSHFDFGKVEQWANYERMEQQL